MIYLSLLFFVFAIFGTYFRYLKNSILFLVDYFVLTIGFIYGFVFFYVIFVTSRDGNLPIWTGYLDFDLHDYSIYYSSIFLLLISIWIGAYISPARSPKEYDSSCGLRGKNIVHLTALITGVIAFSLYYLYSNAYGGFLGLLEYKVIIRAGLEENNLHNPFSFFQKFGLVIVFSSLLYLSLSFYFKKLHFKIMFVFTSIFSVYVFISFGGRIGIIFYFCTLILSVKLMRGKISFIELFLVFISIPAFVFLIEIIGLAMGRATSDTNIHTLMSSELSFPFVSFITSINSEEIRFGKDLVQLPVYLLPKSIWSSVWGLELVSDINTKLVLGSAKGTGGVTGELPTDFLSFSYYQFSSFGPIFMGLISSIFLNRLDSILLRLKKYYIYESIYSFVIINVCFMGVLYADTIHFVLRNFSLIFGLSCFYIFLKFFGKARVGG